ncbi:MAG TPA: hypothetical protein ENI81_01610, partial [Phycisphaerales bacterium]|nr:hypothetical protein [Phycisphaerales bacterium]
MCRKLICLVFCLLAVGFAHTASAFVPDNDDCSSATYVGNVKGLPYDTSGATFDGPGHCMDTPNLWYIYTASVTGDVTVSLTRRELIVDTMLAIYEGSDCYPTLDALIECN